MSEEKALKQRLDKWLFFARVVKSRSLAAALAEGGHVRLNREKVGKASTAIKMGDVLTITHFHRVLIYRVVALGTRRGPATEAQSLYEDLTPPQEYSSLKMANVPFSVRPNKKERRQLARLKGGL